MRRLHGHAFLAFLAFITGFITGIDQALWFAQ
jgi:hypothetical protein